MASSSSSGGQQPNTSNAGGSGGKEEDKKPIHYPKYAPEDVEVEEVVRKELPLPDNDEYDPFNPHEPVLRWCPPEGSNLTPVEAMVAKLKFDKNIHEMKKSLAHEDAMHAAYMAYVEEEERQERERQEGEGDRQR